VNYDNFASLFINLGDFISFLIGMKMQSPFVVSCSGAA